MDPNDLEPLPSRIFELLLKNVSPDDPLSDNELEELKDFRLSISEEEWKQWLRYARRERKKTKGSSNESSPSKPVENPKKSYRRNNNNNNEAAIENLNQTIDSSVNHFRSSHVYDEFPHHHAPKDRRNNQAENFIGVSLEKKLLSQPRASHPPPRKSPIDPSFRHSPGRSPSNTTERDFFSNSRQFSYDLPPQAKPHSHSSNPPSLRPQTHMSTSPTHEFSPRKLKATVDNDLHLTLPTTHSLSASFTVPTNHSTATSTTTTTTASQERLSSAYSAAKYLMKSFDTLRQQQTDEQLQEESLEATKLILSEIVTCLDKTKGTDLYTSAIQSALQAQSQAQAQSQVQQHQQPSSQTQYQHPYQQHQQQQQPQSYPSSSNYTTAATMSNNNPYDAPPSNLFEDSFHPYNNDEFFLEDDPQHANTSSPVSDLLRTSINHHHQPGVPNNTLMSSSTSSSYKPPIWNSIIAQRANKAKEKEDEQDQLEQEQQEHMTGQESRLEELYAASKVISTSQMHPIANFYHQQSLGLGAGQAPPGNEAINTAMISKQQPPLPLNRLITRICLAQGSLVKSFEEYPIRVDVEAAAVDVVWRENRITNNTNTNTNTMNNGYASSSSGPFSTSQLLDTSRHGLGHSLGRPSSSHTGIYLEPPKVLRRERYRFDAMYHAQNMDRFYAYVRTRTRAAITNATNLVVLCTGCGETRPGELEPPVTLALGSGGGTGVTSCILEELFRFLSPTGSNTAPNGSIYPLSMLADGTGRTLKTAQHASFMACRMNTQAMASRVTLSAVLTKGFQMFDLLNQSVLQQIQDSSMGGRVQSIVHPSIVQRGVNAQGEGPMALMNATLIDVKNPYDFERIVGLLLGRRVGIFEALHSLNTQQGRTSGGQRGGVPSTSHYPTVSQSTPGITPSGSVAADVLQSHATWNTAHWDASQHHDYDPAIYGSDNTFLTSNLMITISVTYGIAKFKKNHLTIRIVSPCGDTWAQPGMDLNILSEAMNSYPHPLPRGILSNSPLTRLLMDPYHRPCQYMSVVNLVRPEQSSGGTMSAPSHAYQYSSEEDFTIAQNALQTLRVATVANTV